MTITQPSLFKLVAVVDLTNLNPVQAVLNQCDFNTLTADELSMYIQGLRTGDKPLLLIHNFPNDDKVLNDFVNGMGEPIIDSRSQDTIFEVKISKRKQFFKSYANSNHYFSLHTDCSDFATIPNGLLMLCVYPAEQGGESIFISLPDVLTHLTEQEIAFLLDKQWLFRKQHRSILSLDEYGYSICYNRIMMEGYASLSDEERSFLDNFDKLLVKYALVYKLQANDLVLCNNHKLLHGRTDFDESSDRLIKRIRFTFKC